MTAPDGIDSYHGLEDFSDDLIDIFEEYGELDQVYREVLRHRIADTVGEKIAWRDIESTALVERSRREALQVILDSGVFVVSKSMDQFESGKRIKAYEIYQVIKKEIDRLSGGRKEGK